jgi:D-glycero-alpha-D-manno-heptose 1-phosphate guanylyltransferase
MNSKASSSGGGGISNYFSRRTGNQVKSVVSDIPKCMAPVAGKPFLFFVIEYLKTG